METRRDHWEATYGDRDPIAVSWYQEDPAISLGLIRQCGTGRDARVIDVGGGTSRLVDYLLDDGYTSVTVMDVSPTALSYTRQRLGERADSVDWIEGDVTGHRFESQFDIWHDRAVFHFLIDGGERAAYVRNLCATVAPDGHVVIATFGLDGPERCSGLPVQRYSPDTLSAVFREACEPVVFEQEIHQTPDGRTQEFIYGRFVRRDP
jgi:SAM-dependent methyltransferase